MNILALLLAIATTTAPVSEFRAERIRAHMRFLASDALEGRATATRGYQVAAEYVASQFEHAGLAPGANGSWFQEIPFQVTVPSLDSSVTLTRDGKEPTAVRPFDQFVTYGDPLQAERSMCAGKSSPSSAARRISSRMRCARITATRRTRSRTPRSTAPPA
jgi:Tfp pilus assembly protein FimT